MKNRIILLIFVLAGGIFTSCEDIVEVDLGDETAILYAVEAKITTTENPYVFLYKSQRVDEDEPYTGVKGAEVRIFEKANPSQTINLVESDFRNGLYLVPSGTEFTGKTGTTYTLEINTGDAILTASDTLAEVEPIDSIRIKPSLRGDSIFLGIFTYGDEPEGQGDYYKWNVYINDSLLHNAVNLVIASDELVDGNYVKGFEIFTDFHDPNKPEEKKLSVGDKVLVTQTSISRFVYNYYFQMLNQSQTGSLFSVPPANIESNFTSGDGRPVLGIFTAQDVSVSNEIIIDQTLIDQLKD